MYSTMHRLIGGKRKAEVSPKKNNEEPNNKKRSALGDLTNARRSTRTTIGNVKEKEEDKDAKPVVNPIRQPSKSKGGSGSNIQQPLKKVSIVGKEKEVAASKLPVRQTRNSNKRSSVNVNTNVKEDKDKGVEEKPKRVTRSSYNKVQVQAKQEDEDSDTSLYKTAVSSPKDFETNLASTSTCRDDVIVLEENQKNLQLSKTKKQPLPDGVIDFDLECGKDPFQVGLYAEDIFAYYRRREGRFASKRYLDQQHELNSNMRAILVDWMVEVQESFELNHETLYLAVKLVDLFLGTTFVTREQLQLVGTTALYIAAKYDERCPPAIDDFCYICDDAYPQKEILKMEVIMLRAMDFDIGCPLSYRFLRRYSRCAKLSMETLTLARYILEVSLMEYEFVDVKDSMMAAGSLLLALLMKGIKNPWSEQLLYYSKYTKEDLFDLTHRIHAYLGSIPPHLKTIKSKYSHKVFYEVAKLPLPIEFKL